MKLWRRILLVIFALLCLSQTSCGWATYQAMQQPAAQQAVQDAAVNAGARVERVATVAQAAQVLAQAAVAAAVATPVPADDYAAAYQAGAAQVQALACAMVRMPKAQVRGANNQADGSYDIPYLPMFGDLTVPFPSAPSAHAVQEHGAEAVDIIENFWHSNFTCCRAFYSGELGTVLWLLNFEGENLVGGVLVDVKKDKVVTSFMGTMAYWRRQLCAGRYVQVGQLGPCSCSDCVIIRCGN
jgi:hypothetical protein